MRWAPGVSAQRPSPAVIAKVALAALPPHLMVKFAVATASLDDDGSIEAKFIVAEVEPWNLQLLLDRTTTLTVNEPLPCACSGQAAASSAVASSARSRLAVLTLTVELGA